MLREMLLEEGGQGGGRVRVSHPVGGNCKRVTRVREGVSGSNPSRGNFGEVGGRREER